MCFVIYPKEINELNGIRDLVLIPLLDEYYYFFLSLINIYFLLHEILKIIKKMF